MFLDKDLKEITYEQWTDLISDREYALIAKTPVNFDKEQQFEVVTIWLGYSITNDKKVFGTRVFIKSFTYDLAKWQLKSKSAKEALVLHEKTCEDVKSGSYNAEVIDMQKKASTRPLRDYSKPRMKKPKIELIKTTEVTDG